MLLTDGAAVDDMVVAAAAAVAVVVADVGRSCWPKKGCCLLMPELTF